MPLNLQCRICGARHTVVYRPTKRRFLCDECAAETPDKLSQEDFERIYWEGRADEVGSAIRREFYQDYLNWSRSLEAYIEDTRSPE